MTVVQGFEDLDPQQRAIAIAMQNSFALHYAIDTQTSFAMNAEEADVLFDGRYVIPRSVGPYSLKHYPKAEILVVME